MTSAEQLPPCGRFEEIVRETARLAQRARDEWRAAANQVGFAQNDAFFKGNGISRMCATPKPSADALKRHLVELSDDDLLKLHTLMYIGQRREEATDLAGLHRFLSRGGVGRGVIERTIAQKAELASYLWAGMRELAIRRIEIEAAFDFPESQRVADITA